MLAREVLADIAGNVEDRLALAARSAIRSYGR
jgi:hypothetical protein